MTLSKKILFASHDPGGINLLIPIIESLTNITSIEVHLLIIGKFKDKVKVRNSTNIFFHDISTFPCEDYQQEEDVNQGDLEKILNAIKPCVIITGTSINSNIERFAFVFGKKEKIKTIAYVDSWVGEAVRFKSKSIEAYPDVIMVFDDMAKSIYENLSSDNISIKVVGNPHFDQLLEKRKVFVRAQNKNILFISENISHYYPDYQVNEFSIIEKIVENYKEKQFVNIVIRPHPLESRDKWLKFCESHSKKFNEFVKLSVDHKSNIFDSFEQTQIVLGISSMALIEASLLGLSTFSYQIGVERSRKFLYIPFKFFGIVEINSMFDFNRMFTSIDKKIDMPICKYQYSNSLEQINRTILPDFIFTN
jgi:hypothetical protein